MSDITNRFPTEEEPEEAADPFDEEQVEDEKPKTKQKSVARSAGIVSIAVMFSRVFGLAREMVFSRLFGAGFLYDAFIVGFRIPNLLRDLFAEGALSAAFVKVFTDYQINKSEKEAWRLASLIFNGLAVILSRRNNCRNSARAVLCSVHRVGLRAGKSAARGYFNADNVSVYSARRARRRCDGRFEYEGTFRHSGFGFDGVQYRFDNSRSGGRLLSERRRMERFE